MMLQVHDTGASEGSLTLPAPTARPGRRLIFLDQILVRLLGVRCSESFVLEPSSFMLPHGEAN